MHGWVPRRYAGLVGYRYGDRLTDPLQAPAFVAKLTLDQIRSKASTSVNAAGIFLAISVAVLVAVMSSGSFAKVVAAGRIGWSSAAATVVTVVSLVLVVRQERMISGPETK